MAKDIPTQVGDVLILQTKQSYTIYAVGRVSKNGQQDFGSGKHVKYENDYGAAVAEAKALLVGGSADVPSEHRRERLV
jgi:hypothetical protein